MDDFEFEAFVSSLAAVLQQPRLPEEVEKNLKGESWYNHNFTS